MFIIFIQLLFLWHKSTSFMHKIPKMLAPSSLSSKKDGRTAPSAPDRTTIPRDIIKRHRRKSAPNSTFFWLKDFILQRCVRVWARKVPLFASLKCQLEWIPFSALHFSIALAPQLSPSKCMRLCASGGGNINYTQSAENASLALVRWHAHELENGCSRLRWRQRKCYMHIRRSENARRFFLCCSICSGAKSVGIDWHWLASFERAHDLLAPRWSFGLCVCAKSNSLSQSGLWAWGGKLNQCRKNLPRFTWRMICWYFYWINLVLFKTENDSEFYFAYKIRRKWNFDSIVFLNDFYQQ